MTECIDLKLMNQADRITEILRLKTQSQAPGGKLPSIRGLMARHGGSLHSINVALRRLESEGLLTTKKGSGIYVSLQKGVRFIELHRPQYPSAVLDIKEISLANAIAQAGWKLLVTRHPLYGDDPDFQPNSKACAHVVMSAIFQASNSFYSQIAHQTAPILVYGQSGGPLHLDYVTGDEHQYMSLLVKHLRDLGHHRIAFLSNEHPTHVRDLRAEIFLDIANLFDLAQPVVIDCGAEPGKSSLLQAYKGLKDHLAATQGRLKFTALITSSAKGIIGALRALHEAGFKVPDDCSLASIGRDRENAFLVPSITEVGVDEESWGQEAVKILKHRFENPKGPPSGAKLPPKLSARESTAAPPKIRKPSSKTIV